MFILVRNSTVKFNSIRAILHPCPSIRYFYYKVAYEFKETLQELVLGLHKSPDTLYRMVAGQLNEFICVKSLKFMNSRICPDMMEYFAFKYPKIEKVEIDSTSYGRSRDDANEDHVRAIYAMRKTPICECTFNTQSVDHLMGSIADIRDYSIDIKGAGYGWKTIYISKPVLLLIDESVLTT